RRPADAPDLDLLQPLSAQPGADRERRRRRGRPDLDRARLPGAPADARGGHDGPGRRRRPGRCVARGPGPAGGKAAPRELPQPMADLTRNSWINSAIAGAAPGARSPAGPRRARPCLGSQEVGYSRPQPSVAWPLRAGFPAPAATADARG